VVIEPCKKIHFHLGEPIFSSEVAAKERGYRQSSLTVIDQVSEYPTNQELRAAHSLSEPSSARSSIFALRKKNLEPFDICSEQRLKI